MYICITYPFQQAGLYLFKNKKKWQASHRTFGSLIDFLFLMEKLSRRAHCSSIRQPKQQALSEFIHYSVPNYFGTAQKNLMFQKIVFFFSPFTQTNQRTATIQVLKNYNTCRFCGKEEEIQQIPITVQLFNFWDEKKTLQLVDSNLLFTTKYNC